MDEVKRKYLQQTEEDREINNIINISISYREIRKNIADYVGQKTMLIKDMSLLPQSFYREYGKIKDIKKDMIEEYIIYNRYVWEFLRFDESLTDRFISAHKKGIEEFKEKYNIQQPGKEYIKQILFNFNADWKDIMFWYINSYSDFRDQIERFGFENGFLYAYKDYEKFYELQFMEFYEKLYEEGKHDVILNSKYHRTFHFSGQRFPETFNSYTTINDLERVYKDIKNNKYIQKHLSYLYKNEIEKLSESIEGNSIKKEELLNKKEILLKNIPFICKELNKNSLQKYEVWEGEILYGLEIKIQIYYLFEMLNIIEKELDNNSDVEVNIIEIVQDDISKLINILFQGDYDKVNLLKYLSGNFTSTRKNFTDLTKYNFIYGYFNLHQNNTQSNLEWTAYKNLIRELFGFNYGQSEVKPSQNKKHEEQVKRLAQNYKDSLK